ncbi:hypothetical protein [Zhaonella formicivorans]|uniref:hypothetical protein n=1 Tax=Zhaonella formicivorans TaxID=2528593 RepID=UPI0010DB13F2|nr:hypothetical protein [Zhaonella formicivorans]
MSNRSVILATFKSMDEARRAIKEIGEKGLANNQISLVVKHNENTNSGNPGAPLPDFNGILVQAGPLPVEEIGSVVAGGPLSGALKQGDKNLAVSLNYYGVDGNHAAYYRSQVSAGLILLVIETNNDHAKQTANILDGYGGKDISQWRH